MRPLVSLLALPLLALLLLAPLAEAAAPKVTVDVAMKEKYAKPQDVVVFPARLQAVSGRPAWVGFELVSVTNEFVVPVPRPFVLDDERPELTVNFMMQTPYHNGYVNESGIAVFKITPRAGSETGPAGEPVVLQLVTHARGAYVPGAPAPLALLALSALAFLTRARAR